MKHSDEMMFHPDERNSTTLVKGNIMEFSFSFFEHRLEIHLIFTALAIVGVYGFVKLYTLVGAARDTALEANRKASAEKLSTSAAGAR